MNILMICVVFIIAASLATKFGLIDITGYNSGYFNMSITVSGNDAPTVPYVYSQSSFSPSCGAVATVIINFTASDVQGNDTLDLSTAQVNISNSCTAV